MKNFVPELKDLMDNGIMINNIKFKIFVKSFICDALWLEHLKKKWY